MMNRDQVLESVREVFRLESEGLSAAASVIGESYFQALSLIAESPGKVVTTGVGKSGLIARKIAATMSSTGTPAVFLHPSDAVHGDLGLVSPTDVVLALGKSGDSDELVKLLPAVRRIGAKIVAITANPDSALARAADVVIETPIRKEACPLDLAPTVSTTVALAVGDALAVTLMKMKDFRSEDFARYHPGGKLGKRLLLKVSDLMIPVGRCPVLDPAQATFEDVIASLSRFGLGIVLLSRDNGQTLAGILTDGDIRRLLSQHRAQVFELKIVQVMNPKPLTIPAAFMAVEALRFMEDRPKPLNVVPVLEESGQVAGILRLHELLSVS